MSKKKKKIAFKDRGVVMRHFDLQKKNIVSFELLSILALFSTYIVSIILKLF